MRPFALCALGVATFVISVSSFVFLNDHFDRISRARQIARYGEWPFRDFFDPGYFMTEFVSALLQVVLGDNLLGDVLLSSTFIAAGTIIVAALCWRISRSAPVAIGVSLLAFLAMPRAYDFDKVLFYPLAVALNWRYAEAPAVTRIWAVAAGVVVSALFRYDTGVYFAAAAVVTLIVLHAGDRVMLWRRLGLLVAAVGCLSLPVLLFLQIQTGVVDVIDQVITYGRREGAGTRIATPPSIPLTRPIGLSTLPPAPQTVTIRWREGVDDDSRKAAEARHTLSDGALEEGSGDGTWIYRLADPSTATVRALLDDPVIVDVGGIDRARLAMRREPWWTRAQRAAPILRVRVFPDAWTLDTANAALFYLFHALPLVAIVALALKTRSAMPPSRNEIATVAGLVVLCVALNLVILRNPLTARVGGMIGPAAILAVWVARSGWQASFRVARVMLRTATIVVLGLSIWSLSVVAGWQERLSLDLARPSRFVRVVETAAASPPDPDVMEARAFTALVRYIRECTQPGDRILATFFAPEIPFFAQRAFAGGLVTLAAGHWSERRFQERSLRFLTEDPPALIIQRVRDSEFAGTYPLLAGFISQHYRGVGTTDALHHSSEESFALLVPTNRTVRFTHAPSGLPCFR